jgi:uncharacterized protein (UPF0254 family)
MAMTRGQKELLRDIAIATEAGHGRSTMGIVASTDSRKKWLRDFVARGLVTLEADNRIDARNARATAQVARITDAGRAVL